MGRLFGTDGVRGLAGVEVTAELATRLGSAGARVLGADASSQGRRPRAVVGRDPRPSGEYLQAAVSAGLAAHGVDVVDVGVLPTPAVAYLTASLEADLGVMLSASHNPMADNGIKFFSVGGHKLSDADEDAIELALSTTVDGVLGDSVGRLIVDHAAREAYERHVLSAIPQSLEGLTVVVDCANGAAATVAPQVLRRADARVVSLHDGLDGVAINDNCGSTHPESLRTAVVAEGADIGIAFDGDADRCLAVDAQGRLVDGDQIMGILALALKREGRLRNDTLVATVMSNLALKHAMQQAGVTVLETAVGDRYVLEAMRAGEHALGGEQSGHVILADHASTGDGLLTALHLLAEMASTGQSLADLASIVEPLPQVLVNVKGVERAGLANAQAVHAAVAEAEDELSGSGRVLLRPSGTEPLIRVMVEASTLEQAQAVADRLAEVVRAELAVR